MSATNIIKWVNTNQENEEIKYYGEVDNMTGWHDIATGCVISHGHLKKSKEKMICVIGIFDQGQLRDLTDDETLQVEPRYGNFHGDLVDDKPKKKKKNKTQNKIMKNYTKIRLI